MLPPLASIPSFINGQEDKYARLWTDGSLFSPVALLLCLALSAQGCKPTAGTVPLLPQEAAVQVQETAEESTDFVAVESAPLIRPKLAQITGSEEAAEAYREEGGGEALVLALPQNPAGIAAAQALQQSAPKVNQTKADSPAKTAEPAAPPPVVAIKKAAVPKEALPPTTSKPSVVAKAAQGSPWYLAQPAENYCVQLLASSSEARAQALVGEWGANFHYFHQQRNGQRLYVVTYGSFANHDAAKMALNKLPQAMRQGEVLWVRRFDSIQQQIRAVQP